MPDDPRRGHPDLADARGRRVLSCRKSKYRHWQRRCFKEVVVEVSGRKATYLLAQRIVRVLKGFRMWEVRRLCDDGHQTSVRVRWQKGGLAATRIPQGRSPG